MNYSNQAKRFVNGLRDTIKGTPHEPLGMVILSQWIFESGHFRSKLCTDMNNPGGIQWRSGCPVNAIAADYTDWEGKTRRHFKLVRPEDFAGLYLWFISGSGRFSNDNNPYFPAMDYVEETPTKEIKPEVWLRMLAVPYVASIDGIRRENYETKKGYDDAVDDLYTKKIIEISKRETTRDLFDHRWLKNTANFFHKKEAEIQVPKQQAQEDWPEWLLGPRGEVKA